MGLFKRKVVYFLFCILSQLAYADESKTLLQIIADQNHFSIEERQKAFRTLRDSSSTIEPSYILYGEKEEVKIVKDVPAELYAEIVKSMTISCVDVFVYNFEKKAYLMIRRTASPAKGKWWIPGGRIFKGESFYQSAIRKTKKESGLDICPIAQLGTYSTYFSESAWGSNVHTDTKVTDVLALCDNQAVIFDAYHQDYRWVPIQECPDDPYLLNVHKEAMSKLIQLGFVSF
jgi:colanic acid biosynthesis protein WcaH